MPFAPNDGASRNWTRAFLALVVVLSMVVASGCGKPDYCADRTDLQNSIKSLPSAATSGGVSGLEAQVSKIEDQAQALESSAKSDFPSETSALKSSVDQLAESAKSLPAKPTAAQLGAIAINATAVVSSANSFLSATSEECK